MNDTQDLCFVKVYTDKFYFTEAKKFLALKGPIGMNIVHDSMYPLLKFGTSITIAKGSPEKGMLACFWEEDIIHPCVISRINSDKSFEVKFLKTKDIEGPIPEMFFLGKIISPKISLWWRLKLWLLTK